MEKHPFTSLFTRFEEHRFMRFDGQTCTPRRIEQDALENIFTRLGELLHAPRRTSQPVKANRKLIKEFSSTRQDIFKKPLELFKKALARFSGIIFARISNPCSFIFASHDA